MKILSYVKSQEDLKVFKEYSDPGFSGSDLYIQNLAFKLADETPGQSRVEPSSEHVKNIATCVQQVLINFKNGLQGKTQIERCLIIRRTIEKITYSPLRLSSLLLVVAATFIY